VPLRVGDEVAGFQLVLELGRGAFARVFLAEEVNLGRRLVAVKVSLAEGDEPRILARLQHAHIVPVNSVHVDTATGLRLLCMPFFGGANLAQLLQEAWGLAQNQATGRSLVEALDQIGQRLPPRIGQESSLAPARTRQLRSRSFQAASQLGTERPGDLLPAGAVSRTYGGPPSTRALRSVFSRLVGRQAPRAELLDSRLDDAVPSRRFLRGANGIQAAVWIVARLAEGLDHAHSRGLLHRDLKPANILIAADGTPMLLDFNLAADVNPERELEEGAQKALLGGTLPYMSPEHLEAIGSPGEQPAPSVDERSDLYALGLILFEIIAGEHPFPEPAGGLTPRATIRVMIDDRRGPAPSLRARCPDVPWSLDALVRQCLNPDPEGRYQSASDLAEDLRRYLDDLPMRHCPEPSLKERLRKWARRHPGLCGSTTIAFVSLLLMGLLAGSALYVYDSMLGLAARMKAQAFDRAFINSQFLLNVSGRDREFLKKGMREAKDTLGQMGIAEPAPEVIARLGRGSASRYDHLQAWIGRLNSEEARRVRRKVVELLVLDARAGVLLAAHDGSEAERRRAWIRAVSRLDQAEQIDAPLPSVLFSDRASYLAGLGDSQSAARDRNRAAGLGPTSSEDLTMLGTSLLASGDTSGAETVLRAAIARDATSLWAWFAMGHCHFEQGRYLDAAGDFSACVARGPEYAWCHFNRALALARGGRLLDALASYDRAIAIDPHLVEARVDRALVELELDRSQAALIDLRAAVAAGRRELGVLAALGETLARMGRLDEAETMFRELLERSPEESVIRVARGMTRLERDPAGARADFSAVLSSDPRSATAHYGMARLIRSSDHRAAIEHLDTALKLDPYLIDALQLRALERARLGDRAALDDVDLLVKTPTARRLYNAACALAVYSKGAGDPRILDRAMQLLELALRTGFPIRLAVQDPDLKRLRDRPDFARLKARFTASPRTAAP
jgi:tetratricopeptide (TPR) repeat protein